MGNKVIVGIIVLAVVLIAWSRIGGGEQPQPVVQGEVISKNGIHWHPNLSISVRDEEIPIPVNTGLIGGHSPMHTHETDGTIHLEFEGLVEKKDITVGQFFELWGKEFSSNQLFENSASGTERIVMYVNGVKNTEYENYVFQEHDEVKIVFE